MTTSFAAQLRQIAASSTNELDLRARRDAHAESLLFERDVAIKQDWDTVYQLCVEGFRELCTLDTRLQDFEGNLFSPQSRDQDREKLNKAQNEELDNVIEVFLQMLGSRLTLRPGVRALEWLVRRFRVHIYNIRGLLLTVLPLHETPLFHNVLSLIPAERLVDEWKFLRPYHKAAAQLPRHTIVYAATNNEGFFSTFNNYTLSACRNEASHPGLMRFWSGVVVEAVAGRLNQAKSGRLELQRQRIEEVLHKVLPLLSEGLTPQSSPDLTVACFAVSVVLATSGMLEDTVLDSLMDAISRSSSHVAIEPEQALATLAILVSQKSEPLVPRRVLAVVSGLSDLEKELLNITQHYPTQKLLLGSIRCALKSMKKKEYQEKVAFLKRLFQAGPSLSSTADLVQWLVAIVSEIQRLDSEDAWQSTVRSRLTGLLQDLHDSAEISSAYVQLAAITKDNGFDLERLLQATITAPPPVPKLDDSMDIDEEVPTSTPFELAATALPSEIPEDVSFMSANAPGLFRQLADVLHHCHRDAESLALFSNLPLWTSLATGSPHYPAFLLRVAFSDLQLDTRLNAIKLLTELASLKEHTDLQALLPYLSVLLSDQIPAIRKAAWALVLAVHQAATKASADSKSAPAMELFDAASSTKIPRLSLKQLNEVLQQVFLPHLEEYGSDPNRIRVVLQHALGGTLDQSLKSSNGDAKTLKKNVRQSLFESLVGHAREAPFLHLKVGLINILRGVSKAGSARKAEALLPILRQWAELKQSEAQSWTASEGLRLSDVDNAMASIISASERDSVSRVLDFVEAEKVTPRDELITSVFERITEIWTNLPEDLHQPLALRLSELSLSDSPLFSRTARAALQQITMSTEALQALLDHATITSQEGNDQPEKKKRRRSSSQGPSKPSSIAVAFRQCLPRLSVALEIVDGSKPETHPALLPNLVDVLLFLRRAKDRLQAESPYLLTLCLSAILAIVNKLKTARRPNVDWANIRADLVAECVRTTESPQVQNTALMLSASLASIAPEKVIHHIMPVFTLMGSKILAQEDQHSINVINQAIDEIVPPLVESLKRQDAQNLFESTKSLLSSFVAAFDHIPDSRKVPLFQRLLKQLGPEEFGFAVVAMLASNQSDEQALGKFLDSVFVAFEPGVYLSTYSRLIMLSKDVYATQPHIAVSILGVGSTADTQTKEKTVIGLLSTAQNLISSKKLANRVAKLSRADSTDTTAFEEQYRSCLRQTLEGTQEFRRHGISLQTSSGRCVVALLELVSVKQLINTLAMLLEELADSDSSLRPKAIRILATRLALKGSTDPATATVALSFLARLESIITTTEDSALKFSAIECIDHICTKYGRRDLDSIISSAAVLAGDAGLGSEDDSIRTVAALSLGTMLDILKEAAVPVVPTALAKAFSMIDQSIASAAFNERLHDPAFSLIGSIAHSIPFMISEEGLDRIVAVSAKSASSSLPGASVTARESCLKEVARKVDIEALVGSLSREWDNIIKDGTEAVLATVSMFRDAMNFHTKTAIARSADDISSFLLQAFDLRRTQLSQEATSRFTASDIVQIESSLNELTLGFIYKLSDTTFRPLFTTWVDWATKARDLSIASTGLPLAKLHRQTTLTSFFEEFFSTLKSIVTSYATYLIGPANEALAEFASFIPTDSTSLALYTNMLAALRASFIHDADAFYAAPSHFEPLAKNLVSQLHLASQKALRPMIFDRVIPTLVILASAVQDTPGHHLAINHYLAQLRHADSSHVRLASIRTHMAITEDEDVGDEWVNNVVSGTVSSDALLEGGKAGVGGAGETMIYVNEMLEDDEEEVEREVRKWVRIVRERIGEEVFET